MPATRIQVFRDPATAATSSGPSAPRRRTAPALGSKGPLTRSVAVEVRGGGGRNSAKGTLATATKSLITTNVSTITIDDKENRDPVTGLPLSSLLAPGPKGKKGAAAPQKYIATTITTTVLSPVPPMPLESSSLSSKVQKGGKTRVALGVVKKATSTSGATLPPITSSFPSLADADTDDEEQGKASKKARAPRRSLRIAPANSPAKLGSATSPKTMNSGSTTSNKAAKKDRTSKRSASEAASSSSLANSSALAPTSKMGKLAMEKHAAAVAAAVEVQEHAQAQMLSEQLDASTGATSAHISPARKKRRTSGRKSSGTSSSTSVLRTLSGGVRAFEVFTPLTPSVADSTTSMMSGDDQVMDIDMAMENADSEEAAAAAVAAVQRIIDQQCRELTVLPLANVSDAYATPSRSVSVSDGNTMF